MGVWVETAITVSTILVLEIAPYVGVWVETIDKHTNPIIAPYVGVWIKTN